MSFLASFLTALIIAVLAPILLRSSKTGVEVDDEGWVKLGHTKATRLLSLIGAPLIFLLVIIMLPIGFSAALTRDALVDSVVGIFFIFLAVFFVHLAFVCVYDAFMIKVRFNDQGIEYKGATKKLFVCWSDIKGIYASKLLGDYARTEQHRLIIMRQRTGFPQFIEEARRRGIEIDRALLRGQ